MRGSWTDGRVLISALILLFVSLILPLSAMAASETTGETPEVALPENLSKPEVRDLISRLSDDEVRALLISQLDKLASAESAARDDSG